ncbi:antirestriction protein [Paraburkholderia adhaesiva]|uniref:antirestriction protein n=1 Tax=Paraburkholderia adhaesiva TaxID=2883244 RepID=UPI001F3284C4|nr:antirestriction protein [Paraburkholderia adhaesiva]
MANERITRTAVPESTRLKFLPKYFTPRLMMQAEAMVYGKAGELSQDYTGGYWEFYELSNGGFYLAPTPTAATPAYNVEVHGNGYEGEMDADAFGLTVTMFVLGALCWFENETLREHFSEMYHRLRAYIIEQEHGGEVLAAID